MSGRGPVRVVVAGATGRTGNAVTHGLVHEAGIEVVAGVAPSLGGAPTRPLPSGVAGFASLADVEPAYDVLVDLTTADAAPTNLLHALDRGVHVVLGATGLPDAELEAFGGRFADAGLGLLYVPNFALGAVLMMRFAQEAARWLPDVEVVETHHVAKRDAPSGTAVRTAQLVAAARTEAGLSPATTAGDADAPARGASVDGVRVHSLRLPGSVAHQEVVLGSPGQLLSIRHDAIDRGCYASGVALATRRVASSVGLTIGLENVL